MSKKKVVKKSAKKLSKKATVKKIVESSNLPTITDGYTKVNDGYTQIKTRTFTSTTFDDIVNFPLPNKKFPEHLIKKDGYHISRLDFNGPTKFEKDDDKKVNTDSFDLDYELKKMADFASNLANKSEEDKSHEVYERLGKSIYVEELSKAKDLLNELDELAAKITKEYWQSKRKFILMNKFLESFYAGENFLNPQDHLNVDSDKLFDQLEKEFSHGVDEKLAKYGRPNYFDPATYHSKINRK